MRWTFLTAAALVAALLLRPVGAQPAADVVPEQAAALVAAARAQVGVTVEYDSSYARLDYPGGDVPQERGVCTDVVVRAFRTLGLDLQREVHEDMARAWSEYPKMWGLTRPDPNIDHRRVPNLMTFLRRAGKSVPVTREAADYRPGDIVTCTVPPHLPHVMLVSDVVSADDPARLLIVHNIGQGARLEDRLFEFDITGHYRYW